MHQIIFTMGDFNGIGPEILLKTLQEVDLNLNYYSLVGDKRILCETADLLNMPLPPINLVEIDSFLPQAGFLNLIDLRVDQAKLEFGKISKRAGLVAAKSIEVAVSLAQKNGGAIITPPIQKEALHLAGYHYPGHTEFITELLKAKDSLMILDGDIIRVALVTTHLPFRETATAITTDKIIEKGRLLFNSLVNDYGIKRPRITVCALNCHASDGGIFGDEEERVITPAVKVLSELAGDFVGPMPSDTAFTPTQLKKSDAYLCMYHDQGLIPLKVLSFGKAVNFTAGLEIVRTSPDHGTAYDIAGKGVAEHSSFKLALDRAVQFVNNRAK